MNPSENPTPSIRSACAYILDNFEAADRIAMLVLNRGFGETIQRITSREKAASPEFPAWLRYKNANGSDIYIGMNPLKPDAVTRTKEAIDAIRHVYIDLDNNRRKALRAIHNCNAVPTASLVLTKFSRQISSCLEGAGRDAPRKPRFCFTHWRANSVETQQPQMPLAFSGGTYPLHATLVVGLSVSHTGNWGEIVIFRHALH
jgi:hypothetical protein